MGVVALLSMGAGFGAALVCRDVFHLPAQVIRRTVGWNPVRDLLRASSPQHREAPRYGPQEPDYIEDAARRLADAMRRRPPLSVILSTNLTIVFLLGIVIPILGQFGLERYPQKEVMFARTYFVILPLGGMGIQLARGAFLLFYSWSESGGPPHGFFAYGPLEIVSIIVLMALPYGFYQLNWRPSGTPKDVGSRVTFQRFLRDHVGHLLSGLTLMVIAAVIESKLGA